MPFIAGLFIGIATSPAQIRLMLRLLLADRFKRKVHTEAREMRGPSTSR
jgi:uncharacterized protein (TIGR03435 family)